MNVLTGNHCWIPTALHLSAVGFFNNFQSIRGVSKTAVSFVASQFDEEIETNQNACSIQHSLLQTKFPQPIKFSCEKFVQY
jgi:hypothetical protein